MHVRVCQPTEVILSETPTSQFIGRHFYQRSLKARIVLSQLPFFITMTLAMGLITFLNPSQLGHPFLQLGWLLNSLLLIACMVVPWKKMPPAAALAIPYLDFVAVAFFRDGAQILISSSSMMALFPVFWLCSSGYARKTAIIVSTVASWIIMWSTVFLSSAPVTVEALMRPLLFPVMMLAFAIAVVVLTSSMDTQRTRLEAKDKLLRAALAESQHRERLLETVVDTVGVGVVVVDANGNDRLMNSTQLDIHAIGIPSDNEDPAEKDLLLFSSKRKWLAPEQRPVRRAINGETFTNYQIWIGAGDHARALSATARAIIHDNGEADGAVVAFHDVTEMVNAMSAKDDFVANVSHEFRTPLTAIQSYVELALETPGLHPPEVAKYLTVADRNAQRLSGLVSDLLSTSSITVEPQPNNMAQLLAHSVATIAPAAAANLVTLDCRSQEHLMAQVDSVRISQVFENLLSNAVKYSPDGGTLIARVWADGADLHCQVTDTGLGMSALEQAGVFQKFYRAGSAVERGIPGIGLGLMICKTIIESHGGSLTLESQQDVGTTVRFTIPGCVLGAAMTT